MNELNELKALFEHAAEIASVVPEHLQETAFNRALDALIGRSDGGVSRAAEDRPSTGTGEPRHPPPVEDLGRHLVESMNATDHPHIRAADAVLDRALAVLHAARVGYHIDGLTPGEIATVLSQKFRIATRTLSVSDALGKVAGSLVDRVKEGRGYRYRIMEPGEKQVESIGSVPATQQPVSARTARPKRKAARRTASERPERNDEKKLARSSGGRPGPKKMLGELIGQGFFAKPRVISDIIDHLDQTRGRLYKAQELSPALVRLLRDGRLVRAKNADGQYEYSAE